MGCTFNNWTWSCISCPEIKYIGCSMMQPHTCCSARGCAWTSEAMSMASVWHAKGPSFSTKEDSGSSTQASVTLRTSGTSPASCERGHQ